MSFQEFPPALMVLSPRLTKAGDPASSVVGINTTELANGAFVYCVENKSEYHLDKQDDTTPPDGTLVIAPLSGPGRWFQGTTSDHKVLVNGLDTLAGYLAAKVIPGANVLVTPVDLGGGNIALSISAIVPPGSSDHKVLVDGADTTAAFLAAKLAEGAHVLINVLNPGLNEQLEFSIPTAAPATGIGGGNTEGGAATLARSDHDHTILETGGPTNLTVGDIADGEILARLGSAIVGVLAPGGSPSRSNKNMVCLVTVADGDPATAIAMAHTPRVPPNLDGGYLFGDVNGIIYHPGDGTKLGVPFYFSGDGGATARALRDVVVGDTIRWNGSVAAFQLAVTDRFSIHYEV